MRGKACQRTPAVSVEGCSFCRIGGPKRRSRPGRKMGHVTALGPDPAAAEATASRAAEALRL